MKFSDWLAERHPESLDEGVRKNIAMALGALGTAAAISFSGLDKPADKYRAEKPMTSQQDDATVKLQAAAQKVGIPKSQWNNLRGTIVGGVVTVVNGKDVPLTPKETKHVNAVKEIARRMGN